VRLASLIFILFAPYFYVFVFFPFDDFMNPLSPTAFSYAAARRAKGLFLCLVAAILIEYASLRCAEPYALSCYLWELFRT